VLVKLKLNAASMDLDIPHVLTYSGTPNISLKNNQTVCCAAVFTRRNIALAALSQLR
jgi:hypothetical protein